MRNSEFRSDVTSKWRTPTVESCEDETFLLFLQSGWRHADMRERESSHFLRQSSSSMHDSWKSTVQFSLDDILLLAAVSSFKNNIV